LTLLTHNATVKLMKMIVHRFLNPSHTRIALMAGVLWSSTACAGGYFGLGQDFYRFTYLIEAAQATPLSSKASTLRRGGFETAHGEWVAFDGWYSSKLKDTRWSWMTQLSPQWGLIWGISTGERGSKYTIEPGLRLGFLYQSDIGKHSHISFGLTDTIGGRLKEKTCTADYGDIGGVQMVNCRLAASVLAPSATLAHVLDEKPQPVGHIRYQYFFD
jgi:hypothetical protein